MNQNIKMLHNLVGVVKEVKAEVASQGLFKMPEVMDQRGVITFISDSLKDKVKIGTTVYYGDKVQPVRMTGVDVLVMDYSNVLAVVEYEAKS